MSGVPFFVGLARTFSGSDRRTPDQPPPTDPAVYSAPTAPSFLEQRGYTDVGVHLRWAGSTSTDALSILGYKIYKDGTNLLVTTPGMATSDGSVIYELFGLNASTEYVLTVKGYTSQYDSAASNTLTFTTLPAQVIDLTPPSVPTITSVVPSGSNGLTVTWTQATDNVAVYGYLLFANGVGPTLIIGATTLSTTVTGYAPSTTVSYIVRSLDTSGNQSGPSIAVSGTTAAPVNYNRTLAGALRTTAPTIFGTINTATIPATGVIINSTTGTLSHGTAVTVNGTGFGTKATAAPLLWDDCTGTDPLVKYSSAIPLYSLSSTYGMMYRTARPGVAMPHTHISKYLCASHYSTTYDTGVNVMVFRGPFTKTSYMYQSWYVRVDPSWTFCPNSTGPDGDNNLKESWYNNANNYANGGGYLAYEAANYLQPTKGFQNTTNLPKWGTSGAPEQFTYPDANGKTSGTFAPATVNPIYWSKLEIKAKVSSGLDGYWELWQDNQRVIWYAGKSDILSGTTRYAAFGGYSRTYPQNVGTTNWRYFADLYLDNTLCRVVIGDSATYSACTKIEIQPITSWSATAIGITLNHGNLSTGTKYLYVYDATGAVNPTGKAITLV